MEPELEALSVKALLRRGPRSPVADWLAAHDMASLAPKFGEEGVETLEDLLAVVQAEGDVKDHGVDAARAAQLWATMQAVK